uniref:Odorant receptor 30 n=1 Tax=Apriona germarii TaxID=157307 RepID=A0A7G7WNC8_APRGE|nr:odorant receptor 30 [Apriona germarii]
MLCATLDSLEDFYTRDGVLYEVKLEDKSELKKDREIFSEEMTKNLVVCVQHHKEIMWTADEVERIHRISVFVLFLGGTLVICSSMFQLSVVQIGTLEFFMLLFYLICMLIEQFVYCWFGNEVIYKSAAIFQSTYNTPWVDCNVKFRKILLQFMTQTYRPISILTGGLFTMSVSVFINVVRTAYSYFTLLKGIQ